MQKASVVIPAYNSGEFIERTLQSVFAQKLSGTEIIVVDDGSKDNTVQITRDFFKENEHEGIKARLLQQDNAGVSEARNRGLINASGKYVLFLDSDDLLNQGILGSLLMTAASLSAQVVIGGYELATEKGKTIKHISSNWFEGVIDGRNAVARLLNDELKPWTGSILYNRAFLVENGLTHQRGCSFGEDSEFIMKSVYLAKRVACFPGSVYKYVQRHESLTRVRGLSVFHLPASRRRLIAYFTRKGESALVYVIANNHLPAAFLTALYLVSENEKLTEKWIEIVTCQGVKRILKKYLESDYVKQGFKRNVESYLLLNAPRLFLYYRRIIRKTKLLFERFQRLIPNRA